MVKHVTMSSFRSADEPLFDGAVGNDEGVWTDTLRDVALFDLSCVKRAVILSPHPDDEVLALGERWHCSHAAAFTSP